MVDLEFMFGFRIALDEVRAIYVHVSTKSTMDWCTVAIFDILTSYPCCNFQDYSDVQCSQAKFYS